jgi:hypothetical protein
MKCNTYYLYWNGNISEKEFEEHRQVCSECHQAFELDSLIEQQTRKLPAPDSSPFLWTRIENELKNETERARRSNFIEFFSHLISPRQHLVYKVAALLIMCIGVSYFVLLRPSTSRYEPRHLLTSSALAKVEEMEKEYEEAITQLEEVTLPIVAEADTDLLLLYRDKLETIDAQIARCKEALEHNRADAHIRRYLLAAYQDKKETLIELLEITGESSSQLDISEILRISEMRG